VARSLWCPRVGGLARLSRGSAHVCHTEVVLDDTRRASAARDEWLPARTVRLQHVPHLARRRLSSLWCLVRRLAFGAVQDSHWTFLCALDDLIHSGTGDRLNGPQRACPSSPRLNEHPARVTSSWFAMLTPLVRLASDRVPVVDGRPLCLGSIYEQVQLRGGYVQVRRL
jgi:hypothetical protein